MTGRLVLSRLSLAVLGLAGAWVLVVSWAGIIELGTNYGSYGGSGTKSWQVFMYAVPGFEAGLLVGILPGLWVRRYWQSVNRLTAAVWALIAVNATVVLLLVRY